MESGWRVLILIASLKTVNVDASKVDRYVLPPSKVQIETCQSDAQRLHPGTINKVRVLPRSTTFWIRYDMQMRDGAEWSVVCDLAKGKIIHEQSLDVSQ